jgi:ABC-2 type transport system ATP-binding protein
MIEIEGLTKQYGTLVAVQDLSLTVHPGELLGLLGPNGAGKSTVMKILAGLLRPTAGVAHIGGYDVVRDGLPARAITGYLPESPFLYEKLTGREFLSFVADLYHVSPERAHQRTQDLLHLFDLHGAADDLIQGYSHGMRQKLALAGTLIHEPQVLILDEPTSGLDPKSARLMKDLLRELCQRGATVLMSTHILEVAERLCHRIGIIHQGQFLACGTMDELRALSRSPGSTLEDLFLQLTGGVEVEELVRYLEG